MKNQKSTALLICVLLIAAITIAACSTKDSIVGKWESTDNSGETLEFYKDGTFKSDSSMGISLTGEYEFVDNHTMKYSMSGLFALGGEQVCDVKISGDTLTLDMGGSSVEYKRK